LVLIFGETEDGCGGGCGERVSYIRHKGILQAINDITDGSQERNKVAL
jgi:hypothetical protein